MTLDEKIEYMEHAIALGPAYGIEIEVLASLRELKRLRARVAELEKALTEIAFFEGTPMPPEAAQNFARQSREALDK